MTRTSSDEAKAPAAKLRVVRFDDRVFALGLAVNYLMTKPAFARLPFGHWSRILTGQINRDHYFFVVESTTVVGFAGWALASEAEAEAWLAGRSDPAAESGRTGDCIMLNAWGASTPAANRVLLRQMRRQGKDMRAVYAKREYPDGRARRLKLAVNEFVEQHLAAAGDPAGEPASGQIGLAPKPGD